MSIPCLTDRNVHAETLAETGILAPTAKSEEPVITEIRRALLADQFTSARASIAILQKRHRASGQAEYWAGLLYLRTSEPENAVRSLRASQYLADNGYTEEALALAYYSTSQFKLFVDAMIQASQKLPDNFAPYYYLGRYYLSVDVADFQQAEALLTKSIKIDPGNFRAIYYLAYCQESEGALAQSESNYRRVLQALNPRTRDYALAELGLARIAISTDRRAEALTYAKRAASTLPNDKEAHVILAKLLGDTDDISGSLREWQTVKSLDPTSTRALYGLFRLYVRTGEKARATEALEQFKALSKLYGSD